MLSTRAYSIRKQAMLAISLSWIGGFTNVLTFLSCNRTFTSHVTGTATNFGRSVGEAEFKGALLYGALILAFFAGAVFSGVMTESARQLGKRSKYVLPLGLEATLLFIMAAIHLVWRNPAGTNLPATIALIGSFAMGLQNATITK